MKGEISRYSHRPDQRYSGVFWQMGRMLTDADEIELREIVAGAFAGLGEDVVGSGAPAGGGVVELNAAGAAVALRPGIVYADGVRGEVQASTGDPLGPLDLYDHQVDFPNAPAAAGNVVYYVDIWERTVTGVEDQGLLDAGLHGADTSFRSQLMAQIKWCPEAESPFFATPANPQKGNASLTAELRAAVSAPDPCDPCAEELELEARVGNYLFRLEVHDVAGPADTPGSVVLKWSAENAAEHHRTGQEPADFQTGKHIYEFYSDEAEKHLGAHGSTGFTPTRRALDGNYPTSPPDPADWPYVRRWDGFCALGRSGANLDLALDGDGNPIGEDEGVPLTTAPGLGHVEMSGGVLTLELTSLELTLDTAGKSLLPGDYWLVEVRERAPHGETLDERVSVVTKEPLGIVHHYARLIAAAADDTIAPLSDAQRRALSFPPLTDIPASHVGFISACERLYGQAMNVQQALDALCHLNASKVPYAADPACTLLRDADNVKEALDRLCARPAGGGCRTVVGPPGAGRPTLNEVLVAHNQSSEPLCVCLLPGEHPLEASVNNPKLAIDIEGCGAGTSRIRVAAGWDVNAASLRLAGASLLLREPKTGLKVSVLDHFELDNALLANVTEQIPLLSVTAGERIRIAHTTLEAMGSSAMIPLFKLFDATPYARDQDVFEYYDYERFGIGVADLGEEFAKMSAADLKTYGRDLRNLFSQTSSNYTLLEASGIRELIDRYARKAPASVYRDDFLRLRHAAAFSRPAPALVIGTAVAETRIESSEIRGILSFYGPPADQPLLPDEAAVLLISNLSADITSTHRSLHVTDNRLARLAVDQGTADQLRRLPRGERATLAEIFRQAFLSNNTLESGGNAFVAAAHHLSDLRFQNRTEGDFLGYVIGTQGAYTGLSSDYPERVNLPVLFDVTNVSDQAVLVAVQIRR